MPREADHDLITNTLDDLFPVTTGLTELPGRMVLIAVDHLKPSPHQPRASFPPAPSQELENNIRGLREQQRGIGGTGILQPIMARRDPEGSGYLIIAGERRYRAALAVGVAQVPVVLEEIGEEMGTDEAFEQALMENVLRQDLTPLEEAHAIGRLIENRGYSVRGLAERLGKDRGWVENRARLLNCDQDIQDMVSVRTDSLIHAREISTVTDPDLRRELIEATKQGASIIQVRERIAAASPDAASTPLSPDLSVRTDSPDSTTTSSAKVSVRTDTSSQDLVDPVSGAETQPVEPIDDPPGNPDEVSVRTDTSLKPAAAELPTAAGSPDSFDPGARYLKPAVSLLSEAASHFEANPVPVSASAPIHEDLDLLTVSLTRLRLAVGIDSQAT